MVLSDTQQYSVTCNGTQWHVKASSDTQCHVIALNGIICHLNKIYSKHATKCSCNNPNQTCAIWAVSFKSDITYTTECPLIKLVK